MDIIRGVREDVFKYGYVHICVHLSIYVWINGSEIKNTRCSRIRPRKNNAPTLLLFARRSCLQH